MKLILVILIFVAGISLLILAALTSIQATIAAVLGAWVLSWIRIK